MVDQRTVLLVEDDVYITDIINEKLKSKGFNVVYAPDGEVASNLAADEGAMSGVNVVLLDLLLPKVHGFDVLKKLKDNPKTAPIPVVILSNLGDKKDIDQGMKLGAADYLIKANFTPDEIIQKVEAIIGNIIQTDDSSGMV